MTHVFTCHQCGQEKKHESESTTGYALDKQSNKICFECCGINDAHELKALPVGRLLHFYMNTRTKLITNWSGTFQLAVTTIKVSKAKVPNGLTINRYDTWFVYEGNKYHGVQYGDNTMIVHIIRRKNS